jgi:hypothetical protein
MLSRSWATHKGAQRNPEPGGPGELCHVEPGPAEAGAAMLIVERSQQAVQALGLDLGAAQIDVAPRLEGGQPAG